MNAKTKTSDKSGNPRSEGTPPEFSRSVDVDHLPPEGLDQSICADVAECAALARLAGLLAVESLAADFQLRKGERGRVEVKGTLRARIVQTCVVSLDPFESDIMSEIEVDFAGPTETERALGNLGDRADAPKPRSAELDAPDPIIDGRIDLGALAAEFLILSLDPYPRKPGVAFDETEFAGGKRQDVSPFSILRKHPDDV